MKTYRVYATYTAEKLITEIEAESEEAAVELIMQDESLYDFDSGLCFHCSEDLSISDANEIKAEEV
jgi:hypothetical protein